MVKRKRASSLSNPEEKAAVNGLQIDGKGVDNGHEIQLVTNDQILSDVTAAEVVDHSFGDGAAKHAKIGPGCADLDEEVDGGRRIASGLTLRSRVRHLQKGVCGDNSPAPPTNPASKKLNAGSDKAVVAIPEQSKTRRSWELWSVDDKNTFFEALCEYGKDFENIKNYVVQKNRKKGHPPQMIKNKDQVRHFYYRTWHKISKHLDISDDVKKHTQELYGLINYGELRKKTGSCIDEKNGQKLNELVHKGVTSVRCKGKNVRIKTPVCRALKSLNNIEDARGENLKLPSRIDVEFRPRNNSAWCHVQSFAKNPRLRMNVNLQRRFSTVIDYLQQRWMDTVLKKKLELSKLSEQNGSHVERKSLQLRIFPRKDAVISTLSLETTVEVSSSSVSLQNYRRKVQCLNASPTISSAVSSALCKKGMRVKGRTGNVCVDDKKTASGVDDKAVASVPNVAGDDLRSSKAQSEAAEKDSGVQENREIKENSAEEVAPHEITLRQLLALETAVLDPVSKSDSVFFPRTSSLFCDTAVSMQNGETSGEECHNSLAADKCKTSEGKQTVDVDLVRRGWTSNCTSMTVGEVFMLLGCPPKLMLEYEWEHSVSENGSCSNGVAESSRSAVAITKVATVMSQLLSLASASFSDAGRHKNDRQGSSLQSCRCAHPCCAAAKLVSSKSTNINRGSSISRATAKVPKASAVKAISGSEATNETASSAACTTVEEGSSALAQSGDVFRKPASVASVQRRVLTGKSIGGLVSHPVVSTAEKAFKEQLDKCLPQHRKAKGRMRKSMVVQRELPLLPKSGPAHSMMTWRLIPSASQLAGSFMPVMANNSVTATGVTTLPTSSSLAKVIRLPSADLTSTVTTQSTNTKINVISLPNNTQPCLAIAVTPTTSTAFIPNVTLSSYGSSTAESVTPANASGSVLKSSFKEQAITSTNFSSALGNLDNVSRLSLVSQGANSSAGPLSATSAKESSSVSVMPVNRGSSLTISPPMISSLLDISLTGPDGIPLVDAVHMGSDSSTDKLLDVTLGNSNSLCGLMDITIGDSNVRGAVGSVSAGVDHRQTTPISSPSNSLFKVTSPGLEGHWLNGDASDFSLSNLLSHLESPVKISTTVASSALPTETMDTITRLAPDMDSQLHCLISENSVDYIAKFEDLAAQINTSYAPKKLN